MRNAVCVAGITALLLLPGISLGDSPWVRTTGHGHGKHHYSEHEDHAQGGPPPWAPAHGYRRKHDNDRYSEHERGEEHHVAYDPDRDFGIGQGTCRREAIGALLGGTFGAIVGSKVSSHDDKQLGIVTGAIIGVLVGRSIGRSMDEADQACTGQVLERAADRQSIAWNNPDTGVRYQVTPTDTYQRDGRYCREYVTNATIEGSRQTLHGTACRNADGSWQMGNHS